jgi:hypothetical protein
MSIELFWHLGAFKPLTFKPTHSCQKTPIYTRTRQINYYSHGFLVSIRSLEPKTFSMNTYFAFTLQRRNKYRVERTALYRVLINDGAIAAGAENPHKFWMCHSLVTLAKLVNLISTTARSATYRRF